MNQSPKKTASTKAKKSKTTTKSRAKQKNTKLWWHILAFVAYLAILGYLLFFSHAMGRTGFRLDINLVPFDTILRFWNAWLNGTLGWYPVALNLVGNFVAFMPFGWFLPYLWTDTRNIFVYVIVMLSLVCIVESVQVLTGCGSGDIDDVILNVGGALVAWCITRPFLRG